MARVHLKNLIKDYRDGRKGTFRAVKDINLEIHDREFMVFVGPSGCGKSTSLRMIAGLEEITDGTIAIDDRIVNDILPKNRDIAMVFQNYALYPHMTVFDNMAFGLKLMKFPKPSIVERVNYAADILGLSTLLDRKPRQLSGGQRQRVAVGRAIVRKPKVFLFDEPLSNLDAKMRVQMRTEISKLHERLDATMIYVTHDQVEAMTMGDRICVMRDGDIMQVAEPLDLYNRPSNMFVAGFIGSPPMNFFRGEVNENKTQLYFTEPNAIDTPLSIPVDDRHRPALSALKDRDAVLGIRPEDIAITAPGNRPDMLATVELSEPMGAETYLHLQTGSHRFIARVNGDQRFQLKQNVPLTLTPDKEHIFDPSTEQNLTAAGERKR